MCSSIQFSSTSSCSGVKPTAPSTPNPPALLTATTTSRQWVKAKIGNSMPSSSQIGVRTGDSLIGDVRGTILERVLVRPKMWVFFGRDGDRVRAGRAAHLPHAHDE